MDPVVVAEKPAPETSIAERMKADLEATQDAPQVEEVEEQAEKPTESPSEEESSDDDEEAPESAEKPDEKKPPNRYQKLKAKYEARLKEAETHVGKARGESHEALRIANHWRARAKSLEQEFTRVVRDKGVQLDPRDVELFHARTSLAQRQLDEELSQTASKKDEEFTKSTVQARMVEDFRSESTSLAKKFPGLTPKEILLGFAAVNESGADFTLEQVASNLAAAKGITAKAKAAKSAATASASAPKTIKPGQRAPIRGGTDTGAMANYLKSEGL